jgi:glycosyltransferase involved in cell wall biosynthesis
MKIAILHYSAPPTVGGVEAVISAHVRLLLRAGHAVRVVAGRGKAQALPESAEFTCIPGMDSQFPRLLEINRDLEQGSVPADFEKFSAALQREVEAALRSCDRVIVHNLFTKHFNLPLTSALSRALDHGSLGNCIAWCHDITWTSAHSRPKVHPGYPWDLIRTFHPKVTYVAVSAQRRAELAELFELPAERIRLIYNGVDPAELLGLSAAGQALLKRLEVEGSDLIMLMPVRVTRAKNIEIGIQTTAQLKGNGIRAKLIVTGPPDQHDLESQEYYQGLLRLRRELGVEQEVRFVYGSGPEPSQGFTIDARVLGELYRVSDLLFMPSHREGFGMPILEAGLVGIPVVCTSVPAAEEIGKEDLLILPSGTSPEQAATLILKRLEDSPIFRLRRRLRRAYTWQAIFERDIEPLLVQGGSP